MMSLIPMELVLPNPEQPRKVFDDDEMAALAESIRDHGVMLPILVEKKEGGEYILHDGERRLRAAKMAGLEMIPAMVMEGEGDARLRLERALAANLQRADLTPIEEGMAYQRMQNELGLSLAEICRRVGKSRARVEQRLLLLQLDAPIQELISKKELHQDARLAEALLGIPSPEARVKTARGLALRGASLRASVQAAVMVRERLAELSGNGRGGAAEAAMVELGMKRAGVTRKPMGWDMLRQAGKLPPWEAVTEAARQTCDGCVLRDVASNDVCGQCPGVELIKLLVETGKHEQY
jgi:ParB/RepB/Spo0J family partition protein